MAGFAEWQMTPAVAAGLERLGWRDDDPDVREVVPPLLRGGNVVAVLPPAPAWASPILAALLGRDPSPDGSVLVLAAPALLGEWAVAIGALLEATDLQVDVAEPGQGAAPACDILIASPESALDRHTRSALHPERFRAVVFAWPESWHADDAVSAVLQDIPKDAQRVVLTSSRDQLDGADSVVERYARKALVVGGAAPGGAPDLSRPTSPRAVPTSWAGRASTVAAVVRAIAPAEATIWTADDRDHQLIRRTLGSLRPGLRVTGRAIPAGGMVICYDPPSPRQLGLMSAAGEVILLVPPTCERYVAAMAPARRPMSVPSAVTAAVGRDAVLRKEIGRAIAAGDDAAGLYALAPLFEEFEAQRVAAAIFTLWQAQRAAGSPARAAEAAKGPEAGRAPAPGGPAGSPTMARIWIGAGKKDDATVADFVAVLVREVGVERSRIGRIELRDTFALVEVPAADAEAIVQRLSGITIRKRKLTARVDQGRGGGKPPRR